MLAQEDVVRPGGLLVRLLRNRLNLVVAELQGHAPAELAKGDQTVDVRVPRDSKVRGARKQLILSAAAEVERNAQPNRALVLALGRADQWRQMID